MRSSMLCAVQRNWRPSARIAAPSRVVKTVAMITIHGTVGVRYGRGHRGDAVGRAAGHFVIEDVDDREVGTFQPARHRIAGLVNIRLHHSSPPVTAVTLSSSVSAEMVATAGGA